MNTLKMLTNSNSKILAELEQKLAAVKNSADRPTAYVIDFTDPSAKNVALPEDTSIPVMLFNADEQSSLKGVISLVPSRVSVLYRAPDYNVLRLLDDDAVVWQKGEQQSKEVKLETEQTPSPAPAPDEPEQTEKPELLDKLANAIMKEARDNLIAEIDGWRNEVNDFPVNLPKDQYSFLYVQIDNTHRLDRGQNATWGVRFEAALIASFNPQCKYLRVRTCGAGVNPSQLYSNNEYRRGWFQERVTVAMESSHRDVNIYSHSPANVNNQSTYTSGSSFSVGVDVSANPGLSPSYTVSESTTTTIQDFVIMNKSQSKRAEWQYQLGMSKNSYWDLFFTDFFKGKVRALPELATSTLQPACEVVYQVLGNPTGQINFNFSVGVRYVEAWTENEFWSYTMWYRPWDGYLQSGLNVNFASVHA